MRSREAYQGFTKGPDCESGRRNSEYKVHGRAYPKKSSNLFQLHRTNRDHPKVSGKFPDEFLSKTESQTRPVTVTLRSSTTRPLRTAKMTWNRTLRSPLRPSGTTSTGSNPSSVSEFSTHLQPDKAISSISTFTDPNLSQRKREGSRRLYH